MITDSLLGHLRRLFSMRARTAWLALAASLVLVFLVWYVLKAQNERNAQQQFDLHAREIVSLIEQRLRDHEQILLGGAGLFDASDHVERREWHDYIQRQKLKLRYPGILGVGYSEVIPPSSLERHLARIRSEGFPDYSVKPAGKRSLYTAIIYLEPFSGRNLAAFGYDMLSQSTRAKAMTLAAETGETTISGRVTLVQETHGKVQAGFLMYVPIYKKGLPRGNREQRRKALQGYVYSPYRVEDLMHGILGQRNLSLDFTLYDGDKPDNRELMYDSSEADAHVNHPARKPLYSIDRTIAAYHHAWTVRLHSRPEFEAQFESQLQTVILFLGLLISTLLFFMVWMLTFRRERALELAQSMTVKIRENEERLRRSEERFQLAVRGSNDGIWDWNLLTGEIYYAPRYKVLLGYQEHEFAHEFSSFEKSLHPDDHARVMQAIEKHLEQGEPYDVTFRLKTRGGDWRWFRGRGEAVRNENGIAVRMAGSISDITQQKTTQAKLEAIAQHRQAILDNVVDGIITMDENGMVESFNGAAECIFGYRSDEIVGRHIGQLLPGTGPSLNLKDPAVPMHVRETEGVRRDGSQFPMELTLTSIRSDNLPLYICVVRDITERKRVEKLKCEFVSTVSHELRTPLTSINGALGLLAGGALGELPDSVKELVDTANKNTRRLAALIDDLLDMEKIAAGHMQFDLREENIMALVSQSLEANRLYGEQFQVPIHLNRKVHDIRVNVDIQRFQQVMSNLLSNAVKFSPPGAPVEVNVDLLGDKVRVSVSDRGPGVPQEFRERIFQKFSQADASDTRQKGGTGLGLAITRELVQHMHGRVDFVSEEGKGATFYFELPLSGKFADAVVSAPGYSSALGR